MHHTLHMKLRNENIWDSAKALNCVTNCQNCEKVEGPCELIRKKEILKALRLMKNGKAAGDTGIVPEMITANKGCGVERLTSLSNLIVA